MESEAGRLNIYEMFRRHGGAGFFVRRNSWGHELTAARVVLVAGLEAGELPGTPPYHGNPEVIAEISYQGNIRRAPLRCPGTYAYREIPRPLWWPTSTG